MNASCQSDVIVGILCGGQNPAVCSASPVQSLEVSAIVRQYGSPEEMGAGLGAAFMLQE